MSIAWLTAPTALGPIDRQKLCPPITSICIASRAEVNSVLRTEITQCKQCPRWTADADGCTCSSNGLDLFLVAPRLGVPVHGIIGYDVFKDLIVEINYNTEKIKFYNPETYEYNSCKKY